MSKTMRLGGWVKADLKTISNYVRSMRRCQTITQPTLLALKDLIETDSEVNMLFNTMFSQEFEPPQTNPISDYLDMLAKMEVVMETAPIYDSVLGSAPINHLLIYVMATPSGTMAFINDKVNKCFRDILNAWAQLLNSTDSQDVLNTDNGWLCEKSLQDMPDFKNTYLCDSTQEYWGFQSWNDFFARRLKNDKVRPIASPTNPYVISAPCEAVPYFIERAPKRRDQFWIKSQPYSLQHLLDDDELTNNYVDGTIFQAFLNTANYHRWHAPLDGKITRAYTKVGSCYAEALSMGYDPTANTHSQRYLSHVDTRAIIHIDTSGHANIGRVIFVAIGMAEISSCPMDVYFGQQIKKGDPLGTFMFGGSSYCLLFEKGVDVSFTAEQIDPSEWENTLRPVNSELGKIAVCRHDRRR